MNDATAIATTAQTPNAWPTMNRTMKQSGPIVPPTTTTAANPPDGQANPTATSKPTNPPHTAGFFIPKERRFT